MPEIVVHFRERLVGVQLADPNEPLPQLATDVATIPPQPGSPSQPAAQLESLRASLDELRRQLTTRTLPRDEATAVDEPPLTEERAGALDRPRLAPAADSQDDVPSAAESGASI